MKIDFSLSQWSLIDFMFYPFLCEMLLASSLSLEDVIEIYVMIIIFVPLFALFLVEAHFLMRNDILFHIFATLFL